MAIKTVCIFARASTCVVYPMCNNGRYLGGLTHQVQMFQQNIIHCDHSLTAAIDQPTHTFASLSVTDFIIILTKSTSDHQQKMCVVTYRIVLLKTEVPLNLVT